MFYLWIAYEIREWLRSMFYQVELCALGEKFGVGASTVDSILEVHLVPEKQHRTVRIRPSVRVRAHFCSCIQIFTHWTMRGLVSKVKGRSSRAEMAWCLALDFSTRPLSPGSFVSFISSTSHLPERTHTHTHVFLFSRSYRFCLPVSANSTKLLLRKMNQKHGFTITLLK